MSEALESFESRTLEIARGLEQDAEIGARVHQVMWREKLTQNDVANQLGLTQSGLSKKLRGTRPWTVGELCALTRILRQPLVELMGFEPLLTPEDRSGEAAEPSLAGRSHSPK
ncbi:helix-turn-helix domain-containing protein [Rhodococcoides fascians]|uniref:helix-turn-helix domain-containing protein n=1 Tax=Rhodococcoides fascians TaxID=1828 RepID=UPI00050CE295|nr:transcriptional regulator [Rhodococcus fascians]